MATLLNFTNFKVISRTIRLTSFVYDVIVVFSVFFKVWLEEPLSNFERPKECS